MNYTPPPQDNVEHVLIELDNEAASSHTTPQIATQVQTALGAAGRYLELLSCRYFQGLSSSIK